MVLLSLFHCCRKRAKKMKDLESEGWYTVRAPLHADRTHLAQPLTEDMNLQFIGTQAHGPYTFVCGPYTANLETEPRVGNRASWGSREWKALKGDLSLRKRPFWFWRAKPRAGSDGWTWRRGRRRKSRDLRRLFLNLRVLSWTSHLFLVLFSVSLCLSRFLCF